MDCHCIRFGVLIGAACALQAGNVEKFAEELKQVFIPEQYADLNETPATIAQIFREHRGDAIGTALEEIITDLAEIYELENEIASLMRFWKRSGWHLVL